jgi:acyl-CoA thioesterase FadM
VGGVSCPTLFQPTIYTTTVPLGEIDYSLHKSNSTYLTDLDVARGHHLYSVFRRGFTAYADGTHTTTSNGDGGGRKGGKGMLMPALGGVTCTFRREVRPYARLEIWTRVLAWDDKWIYLISHFVRPSSSSTPSKERPEGEVDPAVYATCVSKYVLKQGRKTVALQQFLETCGFLAPLDDVASATSSSLDHQKHQENLAADRDEEGALQKEIEKRRLKGLSLASHFAALDEGHKWFGGSQEGAVLAKF